MDKLLAQVSLDEIDFACDLERVLAEQVKYLRRVVEVLAEQERIEKNTLVRELRTRIAEKERESTRLRQENALLRQQIASYLG
ncbi:hypothetical protein KAT59_05125 [Candidatus Bipolaricaulota bacterium]|nr:hypothetical protein [Candidatus Bipolaricaulota bacterium]